MARQIRSAETSITACAKSAGVSLRAGSRLPQIEVFQLALGISHSGVAVEQRGAGAGQLPFLQLTVLHRRELR